MDLNDVADFPVSISTNFANIIYHPTKIHNADIIKLLTIFEPIIWILLCSFFIIISILNSIIRPKLMMDIIFNYFQAMLTQSVIVKSYHNRCLLASWLFTLFFIVILFLNDILSIKLSEKFSMINSIEDIEKTDSRLIIPAPSYLYGLFAKVYSL